MDTDKLDALGNDLVLGAVYGYSNYSSGNATTVIGRLEKINAQRVTIRVIKRRHFLWGKATERSWRNEAGTAGVNACMLFPLSESLAESDAVNNYALS